MNFFLIAIGGALGAVLRAAIGQAYAERSLAGFPIATLSINLIGSLLIGIAAAFFLRDVQTAQPSLQLFIITGLLGGFTTFSTFSLEMLTLMQRGAVSSALLYVALSVIGGLLVCMAGYGLMKAAL